MCFYKQRIMSSETNKLDMSSKPHPQPTHLSAVASPVPQFTPPRATHWPSTHFVLAAGTATFQPSTRKVVVIQDTKRSRPGTPREKSIWFLPRGRKDIGESIEACAVRETLEEAGYAASLFRGPLPTLQPSTPATYGASHSEAIHIQLLPDLLRRRVPTKMADMRMYLAFWYICILPPSATRDADYGAHFVGAHEKGYDSELVDVAEAVKLLSQGCFEYQYPTGEGEGEARVPGCVLEKETGKELRWDDVSAGFLGGVEAMIVARGWECVSSVEEWGDAEDTEG